jgi:hypothetical protein
MPMSIKDLPTGVGGQGRTQYFNFQYDDALSSARGLDLAADLMNYCDNDLSLLSGWFSGRALDMSPPITVSLVSPTTDAAGNPTQTLGASWYGALAWPLQVTIVIGEYPLTSGTLTMLARYLLVSEVSEMYMRAINATGFRNPWFRSFSEGNKGEALSRFLGVQFLLREYPGVTAIPALMFPSGGGAGWNVTQIWLDSSRDNWLEVNDEDHSPGAVVGCGTLFLFYLNDQLGYRIEDIINAGGGHLSNVYENLTADSALNAWGKFSGLVDSHYPHALPASMPAGATGGFTPSYSPPLETVFPVSDLTVFSATPQVSWVSPAMPPVIGLGVDHPPKLPLAIRITSSHPAIIPPPSVTIFPPSASRIAAFTVLPQAAGFTSQLVTLTASYAGRTLTSSVSVVSPDEGLPALEIDVDRSADPCAPLFIEDTSQTFGITNLFVFADQTGFSFSWSVTGAVSGATNTASLTIASLPAAGTNVTVDVTVTNAQGITAKGTLSFETVALTLKLLDKELRCRLSQFRNLTVSIPQWTEVEQVDVRKDQLKVLQEEVLSASEAVESVKTVIQRMSQSADARR